MSFRFKQDPGTRKRAAENEEEGAPARKFTKDLDDSEDSEDSDQDAASRPSFSAVGGPQSPDTMVNSFRIDSSTNAPVYSDFAAKMMARMGHKEGEGLGKHGQGRTNIVEASKQRGRRGLGLTLPAFAPSEVLWDYEKEQVLAEETVTWMEACTEQIPDLETMRGWLVEGKREHRLEDDYLFCDENLVQDLLKRKSVFDTLESEEMRRARTRSNPYETIRGVFFLNRAAMKMANMDAVTDFMFTQPQTKDGLSMVGPNELLYFADVCAGPGGFSEYVLWRKKWEAKGFGFTLKGANDFKLEDFFAASSECFEPHYGVGGMDGDGDIYRPDNLREFRKFVMESTDQRGVHFVMADGGFNVEGRENEQEWLSKRLYLCECVAALSILREGGHFVCKLFDVFLTYSVGLIYMMYLAFDQISIFKPVTSRPANSERYIICKGLRSGAELIHDYLFEVNQRFEQLGQFSSNDINELISTDILKGNKDFVEYIVKSNESYGLTQAIALSKIQAFVQNSNLHESRQAEMREQCLKIWQIPDQARTAPSKSISAQKKFDSLIQDQDESCFSHEPEDLTVDSLHALRSIYDYRCYLGSGEKRWFLLGLGKSSVHQWDGRRGSRWQKVDLKVELPADTLIEAEFVQELRGEGKGQRRVTAVHVIDALVLGGTDVRQRHLTERRSKLELFIKAINRPTRADITPIRLKEMYRLEEMAGVFNSLAMRLVKGSRGMRQLCYCGSSGVDFLPTGVYLVKTIKEPWTMAFSQSSQRKYFFNTRRNQSCFDSPKEAMAEYEYCRKHQFFWSWKQGLDMDSSQPHNSHTLSKDTILKFIADKHGGRPKI